MFFFVYFFTIYSFPRLGRMKWKWEEFSIDARNALLGGFIVSLQDVSGVGLSSLLNSFRVMEYRWKENESVKEAIFAGIVKNFGHRNINVSSGRELASVIYYLGQSKMEWKDLPKEVQESFFNGISHCCSSFNEQGVSNVIHG
jgi:hypothetical protein